MLQFFLSWAAQTNESWFDCPENILSVSWVRYIQWEQRNQNSRSEWFYIKNCLSFVLQELTPMPPPLSVITMKSRIKYCLKKKRSLSKVKTDCFVNYTAGTTGSLLGNGKNIKRGQCKIKIELFTFPASLKLNTQRKKCTKYVCI